MSEQFINTPLDPIDEHDDDFSPMPARQFELCNDESNVVSHTPVGFENLVLNMNEHLLKEDGEEVQDKN